MKALCGLFALSLGFMVGCGKSKEGQKAAEAKAAAEKKAVATAKEVQCRFCENIFPANAIHPHELKCPKNDTDQQIRQKPIPSNLKTTSEKLITDLIVEKAIRFGLKKPEGQLTEADLAKVTRLDLADTPITDAGLKEVAKLQRLEWLNLFNTKKITDAGLKEVAKLQKLTTLSLAYTQTTDAGVAELKKSLRKCRIFGL